MKTKNAKKANKSYTDPLTMSHKSDNYANNVILTVLEKKEKKITTTTPAIALATAARVT